MKTYILKRLLLMFPTMIGIITVFFVVSEFVPGGPLDQVETMIREQANKALGAQAATGTAGGQSGTQLEIDPKTRMDIKRKLGLNHSAGQRYLRMFLWCSRDSMISSKEVDPGEGRKVTFRKKKYYIYRDGRPEKEDKDADAANGTAATTDEAKADVGDGNGYYLYKNHFKENGKDVLVRFDNEKNFFLSAADPKVTFDPRTGKQIGGDLTLTAVPIDIKEETFAEYKYLANGTREDIKETRKEIYLKSTRWDSFWNWDNWHGMFLLKFPTSITHNKKCFELIVERMPVSMKLGIISFFLTYSMCILLGVQKAVKNGTMFDSATSVMILIGYSIPGFVLAVFLIQAFGPSSDSWIHLLPLRGMTSPPEIYDNLSVWGKFLDNVHHLIGPILCLTIGSFAGLTMLTKNSVLEQFHQLYATAARARGLSKRKVLLKHVLRNSLIPLVTGFPARFVMMFFAGSLLIEKIFALDGLGLLGYTALIERDFPLIISNMFVFTYIGLLCRLLSDIGYVIVDPRISYEGSKS